MFSTKRIHEPFVLAALAVALTVGFGYGAVIVAALALGIGLGSLYAPLVQAHGHAQLFGWVGLFILGVGLYFLPRLRGTQLRASERLPMAFGLLVAGIVLRSVAQPLAGAVGVGAEYIQPLQIQPLQIQPLRALFFVSAWLEAAGILVIASIFAATERAQKPLSRDAPAYAIGPLLRIAFACLLLAFVFNLLGVSNAFHADRSTLAPSYDQLVVALVLYGVAVPMTIVFAVRNLPLFLRLNMPAPGIWRPLALVYGAALLLRLVPNLVLIADDVFILLGSPLLSDLVNVLVLEGAAAVGVVILNGCLVVFLWQLDLFHQRPPVNPGAKNKLRQSLFGVSYPDAGEYGRFELLVYSAFVWLVIAIALDVLRAAALFTDAVSVPQGAARHALMVGYITLLIFGMAVRMLPGFSGKRGVAMPELVLWTLALGNLAAFLRVVPEFFPQSQFALMLWGLSGIIALGAVATLAANVWATFGQTPIPTQ